MPTGASAVHPLLACRATSQDKSCLALPQEEGRRVGVCRQLMGSPSVAWTNECLIAMHVRRQGAQLNIGDVFGAGRFIRPPASRRHGR